MRHTLLVFMLLLLPLRGWAGEATAGRAHGEGDHAHTGSAAHAATARKPWGQPGDPKRARTVEVTMADTMRFTPERIEVRRGETIRFVVRNTGQVPHEMVIGTAADIAAHARSMNTHPGMEHDDPSMVRVQPAGRGEIVWNFDRPGTFQFACLVPGHFEAGMKGSIVVLPNPAV